MSARETPRKALVYCADQTVLPFALFSAQNAALHAPDRDYDILICSLDPLDIPDGFATLGIRNRVLDLRSRAQPNGAQRSGDAAPSVVSAVGST